MKNIICLVVLLSLMGCANMTPGQKTAAWVVGGVVITGVILSSSSSGGSEVEQDNCFFHMSSDGSTSTVCN